MVGAEEPGRPLLCLVLRVGRTDEEKRSWSLRAYCGHMDGDRLS